MQVGASDGINKLLQAEQEAQKIIADARAAKSELLKKAHDDAQKEIHQYKADREANYQQKLQEGSSSNEASLAQLQKETESTISDVQSNIEAKKSTVVQMLTDVVLNVKYA